ncbi:MAG: hypothetical protein OEM52_14980, partial [bacterium]|nr:hypothetical protein [bacterium]
MPLSQDERERYRKRIRSDLENANKEGKSAEDIQFTDIVKPDRTRLQQIQHIRDEVEDEFYSHHPEYIHYVDRYGIKKWVLEDELRIKRQKGRARRNAKRQKQIGGIRNILLIAILVLASYVGYRVYQRINIPPAVKIIANVETGMVFVNNQISNLKPNGTANLSPGEYTFG